MKKITSRILLTIVIGISLVFTGACGSPGPASSPAATPGQTQQTAPATTASNGPTAGELATAGKTVFAGKCAGCHGDQGQGRTAPAVIGAGANLAKYNTGKGLYDFVSTNMPQNAPGSLSQPDYLNVTSYLLVENNYVNSRTSISTDTLGTVSLQK